MSSSLRRAPRALTRPDLLRASALATLLWFAVPPAQAEVGDTAPAHESPAKDLDCLIEPRALIKLGAPVPGIVSKVFVDRGDLVQAGQMVAEIDSRIEQANVKLQKARVENDFQIKSHRAKQGFLARKMARQELLRAGNIVTAAALDETTTDYKMAEMMAGDAEGNIEIARQELHRAEEMVAQRRIVSPVNGVVMERVLSAGEYRHEQSHLMVIADLQPLNVEVFMPVAQYGRIAVGDVATVIPEQPVGGAHRATVRIVDRVFDAASGTFGVRLALPNPDLAIPGGVRCKIRFEPGAVAGTSVPGLPRREASAEEVR